MPMWRCPHCGTPQAETSRCWVCRRSSTTCSTCRHFRQSLTPSLGYCGLDRRRLPLTGAELRGCWAPAAMLPQARPAAGASDLPSDPALRLRAFVPLESLEVVPLPDRAAANRLPSLPPVSPEHADPGRASGTFFGDLDA